MQFSPFHSRVYCQLIAFIFFLTVASAAHSGDPDLEFLSLKTPHFEISFDRKLTHVAEEVAVVAEDTHRTLTELFRWNVEGRIRIHIEDSQDSANGLATASPSPFVLMYAVSPDIDSSLQYHDHWLRTLFIHEFTHVIHLQMQYGLSRVVNTVFGDIYLLNTMQPRWLIEGMAILMETGQTTKGRIRSSYYQMILRTHALEDRLLRLDEVSNSTVAYPRGTADYAYGAMFVGWLNERFGTEKLVQLAHACAAAPLPYGLNRIFQQITGEALIDLYELWREDTRNGAEQERKQWMAAGGLPSVPITFNAENKGRPVFSPDGRRIVLPMSDANDRPGIFSMNTDGTDLRRIALTSGRVSLSATDDGRLFYTRTAPFKDVYRFSDLFVANVEGGTVRRLTHGLRVRDAAVSPAGDRIAAVLNDERGTTLAILDERGRLERIVAGPDDGVLYTPAFSPDGQGLAVVIRRGEQVDLFAIDIENGERTQITDDHAIESMPVFSKDGHWLLYESDRSGVSNIHAFHFQTGETRRITNALTGAVSPALSPDGRTLAFLYYRSSGWDLHTMPFAPETSPLQEASVFFPASAAPPPPPSNHKLHPYNPLPGLVPRSWRLGFNSAGGNNVFDVSVSMADATSQHGISAMFAWNLTQDDPSFNISYTYSGMKPSFFINFATTTLTQQKGFVVDGVSRPWDQRSIGGSAGLSAPIPGLDRNHSLNFSYSVNSTRPVTDGEIEVDPDSGMPRVPVDYFRAGLGFGWSFSELWSSPAAISTEKGRSLAASMRLFDPVFGGNQKLLQFNWAWREFLRAPWHRNHVFALMAGGGAYVSNPPDQAYFSAGGYPPVDLVQSIIDGIGVGLPRLRGYPWNSLTGDHYQSLRAEYRFPIWWVERTYNTLPVFLRYLSGSVFSDNMFISFEPFTGEDLYSSVGAEVTLAFSTGYYNPLQLRLGFARGLMDGGTNEFIMVIGGTY